MVEPWMVKWVHGSNLSGSGWMCELRLFLLYRLFISFHANQNLGGFQTPLCGAHKIASSLRVHSVYNLEWHPQSEVTAADAKGDEICDAFPACNPWGVQASCRATWGSRKLEPAVLATNTGQSLGNHIAALISRQTYLEFPVILSQQEFLL